MRRFARALTLALALAVSTACGGAGDIPVAQPESIVPAAEPDAEDNAAAVPVEQPASQSEVVATAVPEPLPAAAAFTGRGPEKPILGTDKGAQGRTEFPHWAHQRAEIKCASCHHAGSGGKSCGKGADCHQATEVNAPSAKDAFHGACRPCHKKKGFSAGCDFCHVPKAA
jgi:hypothetical protein